MKLSKVRFQKQPFTFTYAFSFDLSDPTRPAQPSTTEQEFVRRLRQAGRRRVRLAEALLPVPGRLTYAELCAQYANDIARGRELQKQLGA